MYPIPQSRTTHHDPSSEQLDLALSLLTPEQRTVVELTYMGGCSYQEIAAIVGCPVNTVKTRMFYARVQLRKLLPRVDGTARERDRGYAGRVVALLAKKE